MKNLVGATKYVITPTDNYIRNLEEKGLIEGSTNREIVHNTLAEEYRNKRDKLLIGTHTLAVAGTSSIVYQKLMNYLSGTTNEFHGHQIALGVTSFLFLYVATIMSDQKIDEHKALARGEEFNP